ncbi:MASE1 domain-containing protein [Agrobacterium sp. Ap1]|nr:MASE1 domain-containing protein [Agrobacterium sp. Ap1]
MMSVWSCRPSFLHLGLFFLAYVLGCGFADALAIVPEITVAIWPPAGVFIATLILTSKQIWPCEAARKDRGRHEIETNIRGRRHRFR